jgi:hypothetical protein
MTCPNWGNDLLAFPNAPVSSTQVPNVTTPTSPSPAAIQALTGATCPPTQWWFWILAATLGVGMAIGGKR